MEKTGYNYVETAGVPLLLWTKGIEEVEEGALKQLHNTASMPFVYKHVAVMPDVHWGRGSTIGSVIPTKGAIIPSCCGVDIGCGMLAVKTNIPASRLPDSLSTLRSDLERAIPHGRTNNGGPGDRGAWHTVKWEKFAYDLIAPLQYVLGEPHFAPLEKAIKRAPHHLGTLGSGNHFFELCLDQDNNLWVMLHSGSRGIGNAIGSYFIEKAKEEMRRWFVNLPDKDLAYIPEDSNLFDDYWGAMNWAQEFALENRKKMLSQATEQLIRVFPDLDFTEKAINCHHNYVTRENHFGENLIITRKGAIRARQGDLGIIPGSMGAKSFIVEGKGNPDSFHSCSHGAGRKMSRTAAKKTFSLQDHIEATLGVECRKDEGVIDETPMAYKSIDAVMKAQEDLVSIKYTLKQILCIKG